LCATCLQHALTHPGKVEKVRQVVNASFGNIRLHVCRESMQILTGFMARTFVAAPAAAAPSNHAVGGPAKAASVPTEQGATATEAADDSSFANMKLDANFGSLQIVMATREKPLATFILAGFHAVALLQPAKNSVVAQLRLIELADVSGGQEFVQTILSVTGEVSVRTYFHHQ